MAVSKAKVIIVTETDDVNAHLAGVFWLGMVAYKTSNSDDCMSMLNNLNGKVDVVIMSAEIAADRTAKLFLILRGSTKMLKY